MTSAATKEPLIGLPAWVLLMGALTAIGPLSIDMYLPAFPAIADTLRVEGGGVQTTLATFFIGLAIGQLIYGPVSDRFGRKPPLYVGISLFVVASLGCAFAPSIEALIAWRFVQGLGGSVGPVIARAVVRDRCTARDAARALSMLMLVMGLAPVLAPLLGGQVLALSGWRTIFLVLSAFAAASLLITHRYMTESHRPVAPPALRAATVARDYLSLIADRTFFAYAICGASVQAMIFAYISSAPLVLIEGYGIPATDFGWVFAMNAVGLIGASQLNARLLKRRSPNALLTAGVHVPLGVALLAVAVQAMGWMTLPLLLLTLWCLLSAYGFVVPNTTALALASQGRRAGTASAFLGAVQFGSGSVVAMLMSNWHSTSAFPMLAMMSGCATLSLVAFYLGRLGGAVVPP